MNYKIGDTVVHWTYGVGSVIGIEEVSLDGTAKWCYVIDVGALKLWVFVDDAIKGSLRLPMEGSQFKHFLEILTKPGEPLPDRYLQRKIALRNRMEKRTLEGLCRVIRDLTDRGRNHSLSSEDSSVLFSAQEHLLDEWVLSLGTERSKALREMEALLQ
jgi:RNA polymerase-interacting CarD/CdnL/TRCF family regulator